MSPELTPEEEEALTALAGVTLATIAQELVTSWWEVKRRLANDGNGNSWYGGPNNDDARLAWDIVQFAARIRYHVS